MNRSIGTIIRLDVDRLDVEQLICLEYVGVKCLCLSNSLV